MALDFKVSHGLNENGILYVPYADVKKYLKQLPTAEFSDTNVGDIINRQAALNPKFDVISPKGTKRIITETLNAYREYIRKLPSVEPTLYNYNIEHLVFIATLLQKENIPPEELKTILTDMRKIVQFVVNNITGTMQ